jgi:uncharacterized damage-inducible protein DinB
VIGGLDARSALIADLDDEIACTRPMLERLPAGSLSWSPHARARTLGGLASHIGDLLHWGTQILTGDGHDMAMATGHRPARTTVAAVLDAFDRNVQEVRAAVAAADDAHLAATWTFRRGAVVLAAVPRLTALRRFLLHHLVHHRGQLTVYLRLLDVAVPPTYGPTADERP